MHYFHLQSGAAASTYADSTTFRIAPPAKMLHEWLTLEPADESSLAQHLLMISQRMAEDPSARHDLPTLQASYLRSEVAAAFLWLKKEIFDEEHRALRWTMY